MHDPNSAKLDPRLAFASRLSRNALRDFLKRDQPDERHLSTNPSPSSVPVSVQRPNTPSENTYSPVLHGLALGPDDIVYATVLVKWDPQSPPPNPPATLRVKPLGKTFAVIHGPFDDVRALADHPAVQAMTLDSAAFPTLHSSVPSLLGHAERFDDGGKGVVVVVVDIDRLDFRHPDFIDDTGRTRVEQVHEFAPNEYGEWNVVRSYDAEQLDLDLESDKPYSVVSLPPLASRGHGTHVAGIAVGNGRASDGKNTGVAPNATLIYLNVGQGLPGYERTSMTAVLEAVYIGFELAGDRPCVTNLSLGMPVWGWNDHFLEDEVLQSVLAERPGRVVVASAGNDGYKYKWRQESLRAHHATKWELVIPRETTASETIGIWYPAACDVHMTLTEPNGDFITLTPAAIGAATLGGAAIKYAHNKEKSLGQYLEIVLIPSHEGSWYTGGTWTLSVTDRACNGGEICARIGMNTNIEWWPKPDHYVAPRSIRWPGTIEEVITVGSYEHRTRRPFVNSFSGRGPTRAGLPKPDVVAPGAKILSTNSRITPTNRLFYEEMSGTSMAAPHVTGLVARMLEHRPKATAKEIRQALIDAAEHPIGPTWDPSFGHGLARMPLTVKAPTNDEPPVLLNNEHTTYQGDTYGTRT